MKNKIKGSIFLIVFTVFLVAALGACNSSPSGTAKIVYSSDAKFNLNYISNYGSEIGTTNSTSLYKLTRNLNVVLSFSDQGDSRNTLITVNYSNYQIDSDINGSTTTFKKSDGTDDIEKLLGDLLWANFEIAVDKDGNVRSIQIDDTAFLQNMDKENNAQIKSQMQTFYNYFFDENELREMIKNIYLPYPNAQVYTDDTWQTNITNYKPFAKTFVVNCTYSGDDNGRNIIDLKATDSGIVTQSSTVKYQMTYDFSGKAYIKPSDGFRQVSNYKTTTSGTKLEGPSGEFVTSFRVENAIQMNIS
jgi:hypothetical protein